MQQEKGERMSQDIAVIGMAGRFPQAESLEQLLENLRGARDSIRPLSDSRILDTQLDPGEQYQEIAYIDGIDRFDRRVFDISSSEAESMDPHQRLLLEVAHQSFEDAGYDPARLAGSRTGVFVGDLIQQYGRHATDLGEDPTLFTGTEIPAAVAGRLANVFDLRGPTLMVDTACSSSLVAVHLAINELLLGNADLALACGARLLLFPWLKSDFVDFGIKAPDGRARTFSADAAGTGSGEAVACVVLKRLSQALDEGDRIHAVIKAAAVNQDAALSASLTAPSREAQTDLLLEAWRKAGVDPRSVSFIEAHGTGTKLGDPIEVDAINQAFRRHTQDRGFCALSALKTNIGHTDTAAGICGLIKVVLSLKHRQIFPCLHFSAPNPFIDFDGGAVYVNDRLQTWNAPYPATAGVSAFGLSGTNCHVILQEAPPHQAMPAPLETPLFTLSARTPDALIRRARDLRRVLEREDLREESALAAISDTLNAGRATLRYRRAVVARDRSGLLAALDDWMASPDAPHDAARPANLIFLFSPDAPPEPAMVQSMRTYKSFAHAYDRCEPDSQNRRLFAFSYAFHHLLIDTHIRAEQVVGLGLGKIVIAVVLGKTSLEEGLETADSWVDQPLPDGAEDRLRTFADAQSAAQPTLFVEMGAAGTYGRILCSSDSPFQVAALKGAPQSAFANLLRELYLAGIDPSWADLHRHRTLLRAELPTYPFARTRCWLKARTDEPATASTSKTSELAADMSSRDPAFYRSRWIQSPNIVDEISPAGRAWAVLARRDGTGSQLAECLRKQIENRGGRCIRLWDEPGTCLRNDGAQAQDDYTVDSRDRESLQAVAQDLQRRDLRIDGLVHLLSLGSPRRAVAGLESFETEPEIEFETQLFSHLFVLQAFDAQLTSHPVRYLHVGIDAHAVDEREQTHPFATLAGGLIRSAICEYPLLRARFVDLEAGLEPTRQAELLMGEWTADDRGVLSAWRGGNRRLRTLVPSLLAGPTDLASAPWLRQRGVYVITGGASGLGAEVAGHLAAKLPVQLILIGRRELPASTFEALRQNGSEVEYHALDVADENAMRSLFDDLKRRFGRIDGVFHAAGVAGKKRLRSHSPASMSEVLSAKIDGSLHICELTDDGSFIVFFSSINAWVGSLRTADYAAANLFQEQLAERLHGSGRPVSALSWAPWRDTGMAHRIRDESAGDEGTIGTREGLYALDRVLHELTSSDSGSGSYVVSPMDPRRPGFERFFYFDTPAEHSSKPDSPVSRDSETHEPEPRARPRDSRIRLEGDGWTDTERVIVESWAETLVVDQLSRNDDYFDAGGDSLSAAKIITRLERIFQVELDFNDIFDHPTPRALGLRLDGLRSTAPEAPPRVADPDPSDSPTQIPTSTPSAHDYPISHAQRRLWLLDRMEPDLFAYNMSVGSILRGDLKINLLQQAFRGMIARHESLRTTFITVDDEPRQKIWNGDLDSTPLHIVVEHLDLSAAVEPLQEARRQAEQELRRPFDLEHGPLLRAQVMQIDPAGVYVLFLCMHHIIGDAWSLHLLTAELAARYNFLCDEQSGLSRPQLTEAPFFKPLPMQYKEYAAWHRWQLERVGPRHFEFWRQTLRDPLPTLDLPTDYVRPAGRTFAGATAGFEFGSELSEALRALARRRRVSLFMALTAVVKVLLYRYSGQKDVLVGTPVAGRPLEELEGLIGFFINTIALRNEIRTDEPFHQFLDRLRRTTSEALSHQDYPFDKLVQELGGRREPGRAPLFDVVINLEPPGDDTVSLRGLKTEPFIYESSVSRFDLSFYFVDGPRLQLFLEYRTDLFKAWRMEGIFSHLREIIGAVTTDDSLTLAEIPLLSDAEAKRIRHDFNNVFRPYPRDRSLASLFAEQVAATPDATALVLPDDSGVGVGDTLSYAELDQHSERIARYLRRQFHIEVDESVGLYLDRNEQMILGILGVLKANGAFVPFDLSSPKRRVQHMIQNCGCRVVLTETRLVNDLPELDGVARVELDDLPETPETSDAPLTDKPSATGNDLAYIMYTSGSTGEPKGVAIEQHSVTRLVRDTNYVDFKPGDRVLQLSSYAFDGSTFDIFGALLNGAELHLVPPCVLMDPHKLCVMIQRRNINITFITTALINQLIDADPSALRQLKKIYFGGQDASLQHIRRALEHRRSDDSIVHVYGPTEATTYSTFFVVDQIEDRQANLPIGGPIANSSVFILDPKMGLSPIGVPGEIYVGGEGLTRGYLNRADLTAEKLVPDPFDETRLLYATGDLGRWNAAGHVEFLGRIDQQVKIRGFRVELGEVENRLVSCPGVALAAVIAVENDQGNKDLVAYFTGESGLDIATLRSHLGADLPSYMVPSHFVRLDELPLNRSGKVDHQALPALDTVAPDRRLGSGESFVAPEGPIEDALASAVGDLLGGQQVGRHDDFVGLGFDSIKSIQLASQLNQRNLDLKIADVFLYPTVAELATRINPGQAPIDQKPIVGEVPLTPIQHWFFDHHRNNVHHFNQSLLLAWSLPVDTQVLATALRALQHHHDALRMRFCKAKDGTWTQENLPPETAELHVEEIDLQDHADPTAALFQHGERTQKLLNIEHGPLMRAVLYRLSDGDRLGLSLHHLVVDGVSWRILMHDLALAYGQASRGERIRLPAKSHSFQQWARVLQKAAADETTRAEFEHWRSLPSVEPLPRIGNVKTEPGSTHGLLKDSRKTDFKLSREQTEGLVTGAPPFFGVEINELLLTALGRALIEIFGSRTFSLILEGHGRVPLTEDLRLERTVGWLTNMLPVTLDLPSLPCDRPDSQALVTQLQAVRKQLQSIPRKGIGFGLLRYLSADPPEGLIEPEISFNYLGRMEEGRFESHLFTLADERWGSDLSPETERHVTLDINAVVARGRFEATLRGGTETFSETSLDALANAFQRQLSTIALSCTLQTAQVPSSDPNDSGAFGAEGFDAEGFDAEKLEELLQNL